MNNEFINVVHRFSNQITNPIQRDLNAPFYQMLFHNCSWGDHESLKKIDAKILNPKLIYQCIVFMKDKIEDIEKYHEYHAINVYDERIVNINKCINYFYSILFMKNLLGDY